MAKAKGNKKPNILIIWGDDIGQTNLSCYSKGLMGYRTPNIDRIAAMKVRSAQIITASRVVLPEDQHLSPVSALTEPDSPK
jgi:arylsulfatase A-like enzyme